MTMTLDAPATTRREKAMLKREMAAAAEPETTTATELPVGEPSTVVVSEASKPEQSAEVLTDTSVEAVTEPSAFDDADEFPVTKPRTSGLPMVAFKPLEKDMSDDVVPFAPSMSKVSIFDFDDDDEPAVSKPNSGPLFSDDAIAALERALKEQAEQAASAEIAEEKARKEQEAKDEAKRLARIEKRGSRRMLGIIMMAVGCLGVLYGAAVPFIPGM